MYIKSKLWFFQMYGCERWTINKAEHWRIDVFELWCWKRLLRVPWTARRSNQSILKEVLNIHWKDCCWSWSSNTLVTLCKELTYWRSPWCWERLKAGGEVDDRGWDGCMAKLTRWTWVWVSFGSWWWTGKPGVLQFMGSQRVRDDWGIELNWASYPRHSHTLWIIWNALGLPNFSPNCSLYFTSLDSHLNSLI